MHHLISLSRRLLPAALLTLILGAASVAQEARPGWYLGRRIAQTMHWAGADWLTRHEREQEEAGAVMREQLLLKPGMNVCDLGCGNGYHSIPMAKAVAPAGRVFGVDIQKEMLEFLKDRAKAENVTNIEPVLGGDADPHLPAASCDLVLMVDVYHELSKPAEMLAALKKALKPKGQIVLVEFRAEDESVPIKPEHKMSKDQIMKEMTSAGYKLARSYDKLPWQHLMFFEAAD